MRRDDYVKTAVMRLSQCIEDLEQALELSYGYGNHRNHPFPETRCAVNTLRNVRRDVEEAWRPIWRRD